MAKKPQDPESMGRLKQIRLVIQMVQRQNKKSLPIIITAMLVTVVVFVGIGLLIDWPVYMAILGVPVALLVGMIILGRMAQKAQYAMLEGQPGAAAAILQNLRGKWTTEPAIAVNRDQDVVHRVVGLPGIILVSEGPGNRVKRMLNAEKKKVMRVAADVPVYDIQCGDGEGQVPINKLQRHIMKLPRNLRKPALTEINDRLKALPKSMPVPKGPMPKGARMPKMPKPKMR